MIKNLFIYLLISNYLILTNLYSNECNFKTGIKHNPTNNTYIYTKECHLKVGELVIENTEYETKFKDLNDAITLKDLVIEKEEQRIKLYQDNYFKLEDRVMNIEKVNKWENRLYFISGILLMVGAGFLVGQVRK